MTYPTDLELTQPPVDPPIFADYMNGANAQVQRVQVFVISEQGRHALRILPPESAAIDWPLPELRSLPDQADKVSVVLTLAGDHEARLVIHDRDFARQIDLLSPDLKRRNKTPHLARRLTILTAGAIASVALIVFVLVPIMANQMATLLPAEGEQALGDATFKQIRRALAQGKPGGVGLCEDPDGLAALDKMVARLNPGDDIPYALRLHVLDHGMVKAFALPGGHIVLFRGLLQQAQSAEEVAGVLGHEMGHVAHRDPTRLALRSAGSVGVLGLLLGDFAGGAAVLFLTEKLIQAQYAQGAEAASDVYAHELLADAELPSSPMAGFFDRLLKEHGQDESLRSHLASHPDLVGRAQAARDADEFSNLDYQAILSGAEWRALQQVCSEREF